MSAADAATDLVASLLGATPTRPVARLPLVQTAARALDTPFVVSAHRDAIVFYTLALTASITVSGSPAVAVGLEVAGTEVARAKLALTATLGIGLSQSVEQHSVLCGFVPRGQSAELVSTIGASTTADVQKTLEVLL